MEEHKCEFESGWISKTKCPRYTKYRCPLCKKWICEEHGLSFVAEFWVDRVEGLVCSQSCMNALPKKAYIFKVEYNSQWEENGMRHRTQKHVGNNFFLNGREISRG